MSDLLSRQPYKGSRDFYPDEMRSRDWIFTTLSTVVERFGYEKIDAPVLEPLDVYLAKTSEEIVNQQIYSFTDRGDRKVAIRPEMTPTVSRMVAARIRELPRPIRWYCIPNLWRYERPGKGRLREHWQLNADLFGAGDELAGDVEILQMVAQILIEFGASADHFAISVNHRGILNTLFSRLLKLSPERFADVARVMDKKSKVDAKAYEAMLAEVGLGSEQIKLVNDYMAGTSFLEKYADQLDEGSRDYITELLDMVSSLGFGDYVHYDPSIVRGFDYYTGMVFEVYDKHPENRRSLFGGGRYDNLVSSFVKESINAVGFGMGDVTLEDFLRSHSLFQEFPRQTEVYVAYFEDLSLRQMGAKMASELRAAGLRVELSLGPPKLGKQFQEANAKNVPIVVVAGPDEVAARKVTIKEMLSGEQEKVPAESLVEAVKGRL